jgi:hypothetical protein
MQKVWYITKLPYTSPAVIFFRAAATNLNVFGCIIANIVIIIIIILLSLQYFNIVNFSIIIRIRSIIIIVCVALDLPF